MKFTATEHIIKRFAMSFELLTERPSRISVTILLDAYFLKIRRDKVNLSRHEPERILELMEETENRFSGIPTIRAEMEAAGLPEPMFESRRETFKAILYNDRHDSIIVNSISEDLSIQGKIIKFCKEPKSREEIAAHFWIQTSYYVVTKYLRPMMDAGLIKLTIPENPKSRYQKYYS